MKNENHKPPVSVFEPSKNVELSGQEKIVVRELSWPKALKFLQMLSDNSAMFMKDGKFAFDLSKLKELIVNAGDISSFLIIHSTGKDEAWLENQSVTDGLIILDTALEINLHPEIMNRAKKVGGRLTAALGVKLTAEQQKTPSPESSTS